LKVRKIEIKWVKAEMKNKIRKWAHRGDIKRERENEIVIQRRHHHNHNIIII
jgi:hypothetical protein